MSKGYFHRVHAQTPTRFWINNPSLDELEKSIDAGAISCTTNPTYGSKLIKTEPDYIRGIIDEELTLSTDDEVVADRVAMRATERLIARFLPLFEESGGSQGFVTLQSDPRKDEDADEIVQATMRYRSLGPNFMTKIPVTEAGMKAMALLIGEDIPICATEVFSIDQTIAMCDLYEKVSKQTGKSPPFYVTHITGIFDEYLARLVEREGIDISPEVLAWAGCSVARHEYRIIKHHRYRTTMLGGGARSTRHFTDFVGGDVHMTINWSTAQELIEAETAVEGKIDIETPPDVLGELLDKLSDFRKAFSSDALPVEEFAEYGPVQLFRNNFIAGYEHLLREVAARRADALVPPA